MAIAALPGYLQGLDYKSASPGMRFGMYLSLWTTSFKKETDKVEPLRRAGKLNDSDIKLMKQLLDRQKSAFDTVSVTEGRFVLDALAIAPFTTGLGNEHPLENGFAFLNPYGLPYLPGSGVKGVLRQAARELASGDWGDSQCWDDAAITSLFGKQGDDGDNDHLRGALTFWDVIPQIAPKNPLKSDDISLSVEIMTPHQKHYYQDGATPHDSGSPIPISFLTVPPGSGFVFHVQCDLEHLERTAPGLAQDGQWQKLLNAAFAHAFAWLGFGAKTAVGYGQMNVDQTAQQRREDAQKAREKAAMNPCDLAVNELDEKWQAEKAINRKQAGGPLDSLITEKIKEALNWELADKQKLAEKCREALKWLGKDNKKIREKLAPLNLPIQ